MNFGYKFFYTLMYPIFNIIFHRIKVIGLENVPEGGTLICANHSHYSDPFMLAYSIGKKEKMYYMAKKELFKVPVVGWFIKIVGAFPVDRSTSDITAVKTAMRYLKSGSKVTIFPEGRRISEGDAVSAKGGAVMIAAKTGVPVLPVYLPRKRHLFTTVEIIVGEPYYIKIDKKDMKAKGYAEYAQELGEKIASLNPEASGL